MTQFNLNIPNEKVQQFLNMMIKTGFNQSIRQANKENSYNKLRTIPIETNNSVRQRHPYFDWDFYNNDLLID